MVMKIMDKKKILKQTEQFVKDSLRKAEAGHNFSHIDRVRKTALHIAKKENANLYIVELAALLHDIADHKFYSGDYNKGKQISELFLTKAGVEPIAKTEVLKIVSHISFSKGEPATELLSPEFKSVQDADRLDAMGAIGIARAFQYGGFKNSDFESTIEHFHDKLLQLKGLMKTETGKQLAEERHDFMLAFLETYQRENTFNF